MGGLARKATIIENSKENGLPLFVLDAGNLFFGKDRVLPGVSEETAGVNARIILHASNKMGFEAIRVGSKDFGMVLETMQVLERYV